MTDAERREQVAQMSKTIFSYCFSRTGSYDEAEDLSQEILLECCKSIVNLRDEKAFYGFVWKTADNILKKWYSKRSKYNSSQLDESVSEDSFKLIEEKAETDEQLSLIRRELAILKSNYRKTMIEYYINNRSVKEISNLFSISESMVKYLLFQSRKRIKEGVIMERNFGELSFDPVKLTLGFWGFQNNYWGNVDSKISQNILMACYYESLNEEQISIQTGVPTAYLEEDLNKLIEYGLLEECNGFYSTNAIIITAKSQNEMANKNKKSVSETVNFIKEYVDSIEEKVREIGFYGCDMPKNSIRWAIISKLLKTAYVNEMHERNQLEFPVDKFGQKCFRWFVEETPDNSPYGLGLSSIGAKKGHMEFWDVKINGEYVHNKIGDVFANMLTSLPTTQPETETEKLVCTELINRGYAVNTDEGIKPNFPCFTKKQYGEFMSYIEPAVDTICKQATSRLDVIRQTACDHTPERLVEYAKNMALLLQFEEVENIMGMLCEDGWLLPYKNGMNPTTIIYLLD